MKRKLKITDHALVRYLEKVKNIDMERFREEMSKQIDHEKCFDGKGVFATTHFAICVRDNTVVTCGDADYGLKERLDPIDEVKPYRDGNRKYGYKDKTSMMKKAKMNKKESKHVRY